MRRSRLRQRRLSPRPHTWELGLLRRVLAAGCENRFALARRATEFPGVRARTRPALPEAMLTTGFVCLVHPEQPVEVSTKGIEVKLTFYWPGQAVSAVRSICLTGWSMVSRRQVSSTLTV